MKKLVDKLVEKCTENVEEVKLGKITPAENERNRSSCILYIMLFSVIFTVNVGIGSYFLYLHWYFKKYFTRANNLIN